jgi:hypothetical protein
MKYSDIQTHINLTTEFEEITSFQFGGKLCSYSEVDVGGTDRDRARHFNGRGPNKFFS